MMGGLPRNRHFSLGCQFLRGTRHAILTFLFASAVQSRAHNTGNKLCKKLSLCASSALLFWSQVWPSFDAVELPRTTVTAHNPALELAHRRFASDQVTGAMRPRPGCASAWMPAARP